MSTETFAERWATTLAATLAAHADRGTDGVNDDTWAICSCGWRGPTRHWDEGDALHSDHRAHLAETLGRGAAAACAAVRCDTSDSNPGACDTCRDAALAAFTEAIR